MSNFENYERYDMVCAYIRCNKNSRRASEEYFNNFPERRQPNIKIFKKLDQNLKAHGCFSKPVREFSANEQQEELVLASVVVNPEISTRQIESDVNIPKSTVSTILKKHKYHPYKLHVSQTLRPGDAERRETFCRWYINKVREDENFSNKVLWSDETYFSNCGLFNRHNVHYWSQNNPHINVQTRNQVRFGFNVWCGLLGNRLIGPIIFNGTLTAQRYLQLLRTDLEDLLDDIPLALNQTLWLQQDGAPAHNAHIVTEYVMNRFHNNVIATHSDVRWPPRSPDITPMDSFLWGFVKNKVYGNRVNFNNIDELQAMVIDAFHINRNTLGKATANVLKRCQVCVANNGEIFENLL